MDVMQKYKTKLSTVNLEPDCDNNACEALLAKKTNVLEQREKRESCYHRLHVTAYSTQLL